MDDADDGVIDKEELLRANFITGAGLSEKEIDAILLYVDFNYGGKFNFSNILKMLYRIQPQ
jgi:Ca2+-binding EF-hand superfamily protein